MDRANSRGSGCNTVVEMVEENILIYRGREREREGKRATLTKPGSGAE